MLLEILAIPMSHSDPRVGDFSWKEESNNIFSSTSAYKTLTFHGVQNDKNWSWIWKTPTLPKVQMFLWLLPHSRIKSLEYLRHLGIVDNLLCKICKGHIESLDHNFHNCLPAVDILNRLSFEFTANHNILDFYQWLYLHYSNRSSSPFFNIPCAAIFYFTLWTLWNRRNQFLCR
ncbi:hypothetical protein SLE2022_308700 [Rubroshorea leprosula]